jgi:DNA-binding protein HU-beta
MNKSELVEKMAAETGGSNAEASRYLDAFLATVEGELKSGGEVQIPGFGKFKVNERAAREGRNPATGEKMQIKASKSPSFSAGNSLKEAVN